jgi:Rac GTPase-activating protein 1
MVFLFEEFIQFAVNQEENRKKWLAAVQETQRLQRELEKTNQNITVLDAKLNHARRLLDKEKKKRLEAESNSTALVRELKLFICICIHI